MKLKYLLIVEGILSLITGFFLTLFPGTTLELYGLSTDHSSIFMTQNLGGMYIGLGILALLARNMGDPSARQLVVRIFLVVHVILLAIAIQTQTIDSFDFKSGWTSVVFELVFSIAFAYFAGFQE